MRDKKREKLVETRDVANKAWAAGRQGSQGPRPQAINRRQQMRDDKRGELVEAMYAASRTLNAANKTRDAADKTCDVADKTCDAAGKTCDAANKTWAAAYKVWVVADMALIDHDRHQAERGEG